MSLNQGLLYADKFMMEEIIISQYSKGNDLYGQGQEQDKEREADFNHHKIKIPTCLTLP